MEFSVLPTAPNSSGRWSWLSPWLVHTSPARWARGHGMARWGVPGVPHSEHAVGGWVKVGFCSKVKVAK